MESTPARQSQKMSGRTKAALWLVIAPSACIVIAILLALITNLVFNPTFWPKPDSEPFAPTPVGITVINVFTFILVGTGILAWLPGLIVGIVLLATRKASGSR